MVRTLFLLLVVLATLPAAAGADTPATITTTGFITRLAIHDDLRCEADSARPPQGRVFHENSACATLASVDGVLYGSTQIPGYSAATAPHPFTPVSQSAVRGNGADPLDAAQITTEVTLGDTGIVLVETDTYASYADNWRTEIEVQNHSASDVHDVVLYRVGDCGSGEQDADWAPIAGIPARIQQSVGCRAVGDGNIHLQGVFIYSVPVNFAHGDEDLTSHVWDAVATGSELPSSCCAQGGDQAIAMSFPLRLVPYDRQVRTTFFRVTDNVSDEISLARAYASVGEAQPGEEAAYDIEIGGYAGAPEWITVHEVVVRLPHGASYVPGSTTGEISTDPQIDGDRLTWRTDMQVYNGLYRYFRLRFRTPDTPGPYAARIWTGLGRGFLVPADGGRFTVVDATRPPETALLDVPPALSNNARPVFRFSGATQYRCTLTREGETPAAPAACASPYTADALADGTYTFAVAAINAGGQADPTPATATFTVDTTPAETAIDDGPAGLTNVRTPTFTVRAGEASARLECRVDADAWSACAASTTVRSLDDGDHRFQARAIDLAGNADATPATRAFSVDATAPDTVFGPLPAGVLPGPLGSSVTTRSLALRADATTSVRVACDAQAPCAGTLTLSTARALVARAPYALAAGTSRALALALPPAIGDRAQRAGAVRLWASTGAGRRRALTLRPDRGAPRLLEAGTSVPVVGGAIALRVSCRPPASCHGRLELRDATRVLATARVRGPGRVRLRLRGVTRTFPATLRFRDPRGATRARATLILEKESGR